MKVQEITGNLWTVPADVTVITTNGNVNKRGEAVMGRGVAEQAKRRYPELAARVGTWLQTVGNKVGVFPVTETDGTRRVIVTLPVKHNWHDRANINLIQDSLLDLADLAEVYGWKKVAMVRPGCGNGQLDWTEVNPIVRYLLDDRFIIVQN